MEQLNFLPENLKEIFPPQLPGRKYVTESSLGIVARVGDEGEILSCQIAELCGSYKCLYQGFMTSVSKTCLFFWNKVVISLTDPF